MQSICTGLLERSFAMPVSLSASLPALGWPRLLHSGLVVPAVELAACVASREARLSEDFADLSWLWAAVAFVLLFVVALSCARAALDAPSSAATASALI
jgi:hypothetical protein